jgi:hypothetical protein
VERSAEMTTAPEVMTEVVECARVEDFAGEDVVTIASAPSTD